MDIPQFTGPTRKLYFFNFRCKQCTFAWVFFGYNDVIFNYTETVWVDPRAVTTLLFWRQPGMITRYGSGRPTQGYATGPSNTRTLYPLYFLILLRRTVQFELLSILNAIRYTFKIVSLTNNSRWMLWRSPLISRW